MDVLSICSGASPSSNTGEVQVRTWPNFSSAHGPDHHVFLATVSGEANVFDGVSWRPVCDGIYCCSGVHIVVTHKHGPDLGVRHGHCKCRPWVCILRATAHRGFPGI